MSEEFSFRDIVELAQDVIIVTRAEPLDPPGPVIFFVNPAFTRLTGYSREEAIGQNPRILQGAETDDETTHLIRARLENDEPVHVAIENYGKDGRSYWLDLSIMPLRNASGDTTHFVAFERDISLQKRLERQLTELALRDPLTSLFNRREYYESIDSEWSHFRDSNVPFASSEKLVSVHFSSSSASRDTGKIGVSSFFQLVRFEGHGAKVVAPVDVVIDESMRDWPGSSWHAIKLSKVVEVLKKNGFFRDFRG